MSGKRDEGASLTEVKQTPLKVPPEAGLTPALRFAGPARAGSY